MEKKELMQQIEAILFAAARAVSKEELKSFCVSSDEEISEAVDALSKKLEETESAIMLISESNGWKLAVREKFTTPLRNIVPNTELNRSVLETLAVIAWKQPVMQAEVIHIRTTKAYEHIAELEELGFIARQKHGRSFVLRTSKKFNEYFDLPKQEAIKELFKDIKDESGKADNPQKKLDETPNVEVYNLEKNEAGEFVDDKLGRLDTYETSAKEKSKSEDESQAGPTEEFYEQASDSEENEDIKKNNRSEKNDLKKDVYVDLTEESDDAANDNSEKSEEEKETGESQEDDNSDDAKEEKQDVKEDEIKNDKDTGRKLEYELEEMLEPQKEEKPEAKKEISEDEE